MIVALTPNLSLDRTMTLDRPLLPGQLHRVTELTVAAGGKGVNLARAVRAFGGASCVAGVVGGFNGQHFRALLDAEGLGSVLENGEGETRECQAFLSGGDAGKPTPPRSTRRVPRISRKRWPGCWRDCRKVRWWSAAASRREPQHRHSSRCCAG